MVSLLSLGLEGLVELPSLFLLILKPSLLLQVVGAFDLPLVPLDCLVLSLLLLPESLEGLDTNTVYPPCVDGGTASLPSSLLFSYPSFLRWAGPSRSMLKLDSLLLFDAHLSFLLGLIQF